MAIVAVAAVLIAVVVIVIRASVDSTSTSLLLSLSFVIIIVVIVYTAATTAARAIMYLHVRPSVCLCCLSARLSLYECSITFAARHGTAIPVECVLLAAIVHLYL